MPPRGEKLTMPEYTQPFREVRWIWNYPNQVSIVMNGLAQDYVRVDNIPLHHLKEFSQKFKEGYIKIPYFKNGNRLQFLFHEKEKKIFVCGEVEDRRKKGYKYELTINLEDWDNTIKEIEKSASENTSASPTSNEGI